MNSNDRYALIALMFLIVIVAVAAFWDDGGEAHAAPPADETVASNDDAATFRRDRGAEAPRAGGLPMGGTDEIPPVSDRTRTPGLGNDGHTVRPGTLTPAPTDAFDSPAPVDRVELEPDGPLLPHRDGGGASFVLDTVDPRIDQVPAPATPKPVGPKPVAPKVDPAPEESASRTYVVKAGDSLSAIARSKCGTVDAIDEIARLNGLDDVHTIHEGDELTLPARRVSGAPKIADGTRGGGKAPKPDAKGRRTVTIAKGEVLGTVLDRELGSYSKTIALVEKLNPGLERDDVIPGQVIILPRKSELPSDLTSKGSRVARNEPSPPAKKKKNFVR